MLELTLPQFEGRAEEFDRAAASSELADWFCSSSCWILPAHAAFAPGRELVLRESAAGFAAFAGTSYPALGRCLEPLETMWALGCPLVARGDPLELVEDLSAEIQGKRKGWDAVVVSGLTCGDALYTALGRTLSRHRGVMEGPQSSRYRASLEGGLDGYLSRRTRKFKANLRRSERLAQEAGVEFEMHRRFGSEREVLSLYERILRIEARSWKAQRETGLVSAEMRAFYRAMLLRLLPLDAVRAVIALVDGADAGFIFGALLERAFRGLQMSYDARFSRISLGNLLQIELIRSLCDEGCLTYDLGMEVPYKSRWSDECVVTTTLVALPRVW